jgi:Cu-processing system ATP-binding protein
MKRIELQDISVRFGAVEALRHVSLELEPGQATMLAGPNGSGKSTLMGVLLGLVRTTSGSFLVDGRVRKPDQRFKQDIGYLPEAVAFARNLTGRQVLRFFCRARGVPKRRMEEVLDLVKLDHAAGRHVSGYSRGMLQRLGLAVAILADPQLLVLDEPTGGLDQAGLAVLWDIVAHWRADGRFVLVASHDLALMERRMDHVLVLSNGRTLAVGSPEELRNQVELPVQVHFDLRPGNDGQELFEASQNLLGSGSISHEGTRITASARPEQLLVLMALQHDSSDSIAGLRVEEPGFDEVYESLLERDA